ncbi:hypothetical protein shim_03110 [Shimia sp. SK013]|uniref:SAP domain-containing protein n=1 Tax=Shimia sp. SK013 TaxID=1389006 RepID=UPI0006B56833|nr:SAP domain-containing protein [Shimia sp. SK013]KPA23378.1 hypothetical protein shim_03110 [Shimia sp. SK013]
MFRKLFGFKKDNSPDEPTTKPRSVQLDSNQQVQFLSLFTSPADVAKRLNANHTALWEDKLGAPVFDVIAALTDAELLREATLSEKLEASFKLSELKEMASSQGVKASGKKADIAERIASSSRTGFCDELGGRNILICTDRAQDAVSEHKAAKKLDLERAQLRTLELLRARNFSEACNIVCRYEEAQFYQRGIGVNWKSADQRLFKEITIIFKANPGFHKSRYGGVSQASRELAAMFSLWGTERFGRVISDELLDNNDKNRVLAARMLLFFARNKLQVDQAKRLSQGYRFEVLKVKDRNSTCLACRSDDGHLYDLDNVPELPHPDCNCEVGCRCNAVLVPPSNR